MSRWLRKKRSSKTENTLDGVEAVGHLIDLGPVGFGIAVVGGLIGVVVGVFKFMDRRF